VAAPFRYQGLAREVVLRTKVDGDQRALALIEEALATSPPVVRLLRSSDLLMPCPSSLWGRWRGRLDIPGCAAVRLAAEHRLPLVPAPPWLFWRWRKRALHHQADSPPTRYSPPSTKTANQWRAKLTRFGRSEALRIVLVDDVVTSGATLAELAAALGEQGFYVTQAITFACAPRLAHAATAANEPEFRCND
jgi:predicted amidophosphoribosyltransferase